MSHFFTDHFRETIQVDQTIMDGKKVRLILFRYSPNMGALNPAWTAASTLDELLVSGPGWTEVSGMDGYPLTLEMDVGTRIVDTEGTGGSKYVMFSTYPFAELSSAVAVTAFGIEVIGDIAGVTNPLAFVTNSPLIDITNIHPGDKLTASPDNKFPDNTNRWLFGWSVSAPDPTEGPLLISLGAPEFEVSGSQHAWMYPQRVNYIANPSFEAPGVDYWSANGAITRVSATTLDEEGNEISIGSPAGGAWFGQCAGNGSYAIMESNIFSTLLGESYNEQWTIQLMAKGTGTLKVGLVYWDGYYRDTSVNWGEYEEWELDPGAWIHIATHRHAPEAHIAMVRLECKGTDLCIDKVLAEPGYLKDWRYFDGDEKYGARDDFSWYGGYNRAGASYSVWYNHRKAVTGRLFARTVDPNDPTQNVTDEDMEEQGLVYRWVPAGITVVPHLDVLYPHDLQNPVSPKPPGILPYYPASLDGVMNPWEGVATGGHAFWDNLPGWDDGTWAP